MAEFQSRADTGSPPMRSRQPQTETGKSKLTTFIVIKEFCGIEEGVEIERNAGDLNTKYMVDKGYLRAK